MKKKYGDGIEWKRVKKRNYHVRAVENQGFVTYETRIDLLEVSPPLLVKYEKESLCIADNCYKWIQWFQEGSFYTLTAMVNEEGAVVQYYYDMCLGQGFDIERKSPWYLDAYIDLVFLPDGTLYILDEDEFAQAVRTGALEKDEANRIERSLNRLIAAIKEETEPLIKLYKPNPS